MLALCAFEVGACGAKRSSPLVGDAGVGSPGGPAVDALLDATADKGSDLLPLERLDGEIRDHADASVDSTSATEDASCRLDAYPTVRICCGLPDDVPGGNCTLESTLMMNQATCVPEGAGFDLKNGSLGIHCCVGLTTVSVATESANGTCQRGPVSAAVCEACGDGVCKNGENRCNCPTDCK
jgi:hypothetical protein